MKTILFNILVVIVVIAVALPAVGGTLATWSDSETSEGNYIETGSLDLLVARCDADGELLAPFKDDLPWGVGLEPCFNIPELELCNTYACYRLLWNAGCVDGVAYLHIKDVADNQLASNTYMHLWYDDDGDPETPLVPVWYDDDGDPETPLVPVESDPIADLDCHQIKLGALPAEAERQLKLEIHAYSGAAGEVLSFDVAFELVQFEIYGPRAAWADTEKSPNWLGMPSGEGCTPGGWAGGNLRKLWDKPSDLHWTAKGGDGTNPYIHTTPFNDFFDAHDDLDGLTMYMLVKGGAGPKPVRKAARGLVAAYLNASFGIDYPLTADEVSDAWTDAVDAGTNAAFTALHLLLVAYNELGCPL